MNQGVKDVCKILQIKSRTETDTSVQYGSIALRRFRCHTPTMKSKNNHETTNSDDCFSQLIL